MLKLIIEDDEGRKTVVPFVRDEITIGRQEGNTIRLTERNVSRRHARLLRQNGHVVVEDLGSYNGIRVNGEKIAEPAQVRSGDLIQIGDYDLAIQEEAQAHPLTPPGMAPVVQAPTPVPPAHAPPAAPPHLEEEGHEDTLRSRKSPVADSVGEERAEAAAPAAERDARRQSTAVIRIDKLEGSSRREIQELDATFAPRLVVMNTELAGREYACIRTQLHLGRTEENDIQIDHRSMSRTHAKLVQDEQGDWRVVDLQSANGLRINGESYGQAALASGDVLELGHVKLKFLAPGERYVPPRNPDGKRGLGLYLGLAGAALLLLGATGFWVMTRSPEPVPAPPPVAKNDPAAPVETPAPPPAEIVAAPNDSQGTTVTAAARAAEATEKARVAREQMAARDFEGALETLDTLQRADGTYPDEVTSLVDEAQSEATAKNNLEQAEQALESGKLDHAQALLGQAQDSTAFTREYDRLKSRTDAAVAREARKLRPTPKPVVAAATNTADAQKFLEEGIAMLKKRQFTQARDSLSRCLRADKGMARCHMYLGSAYAKLRDIDSAARHYRAFVELAPQDPFAPKISEFLRDHDSQRR
ncbi:MAG: FHA domain-containing protein [Myxococcota bacterium]|nr:FHA domain-containing protein [Myxococcota bacterium]